MNAPLDTVNSSRRHTQALPTALQLRKALPLSPVITKQVQQHRSQVEAILAGTDPRLMVIVGPCSLHDKASALEYAERLSELAQELSDQLFIVMRAYVEKPRTTVGWKGLVYDPHLDGSGDMAQGLRVSRELMLAIAEKGLPVASEILQPQIAGYLDDLLSWAAIGARTTESQIHREMASGLDFAVGFKNGTDGSVHIACDAIHSAARAHQHFAVDELGRPALALTQGNPYAHLVLRGGNDGPNYHAPAVRKVKALLQSQNLAPRIVVDCSHANSGKDPIRQPEVFADVLRQRLAGEQCLRGVMIEGHLFSGSQKITDNLKYGVSVTDACLGFEQTARLLKDAAELLR